MGMLQHCFSINSSASVLPCSHYDRQPLNHCHTFCGTTKTEKEELQLQSVLQDNEAKPAVLNSN